MRKIFLSIAFMFISFLSTPIFAQLEDLGDDPDAATPMPIDNFVLVLLAVGLIYVFITYKNYSSQKNSKS